MMRIECPWCGSRSEDEFVCGGQSHIVRPDPAAASDEEWAVYLYQRDNPKGLHCERWLHRFGCGQWFNLVRDTVSHRVHAVYPVTGPKPELPAADGGGA